MAADDLTSDGTFTFGAGFGYDFDPTDGVGPGLFDWQGVAMHEISEIMGRIGISGGGIGGVTSYTLLDDLSFKGVGTRGLGGGTGNFFSIDFGTTLLKEFNGVASGDTRDWASGTLDSFNAFSSSGVANPLTAIDFRVMDVLGYDKIAVVSGTPEPGTLALFAIALSGLAWRRRKQ